MPFLGFGASRPVLLRITVVFSPEAGLYGGHSAFHYWSTEPEALVVDEVIMLAQNDVVHRFHFEPYELGFLA